MKEITGELKKRGGIICMNCGRIYEGSGADYEENECVCGNGWFNWIVPGGEFINSFWGSPAATKLYNREQMPR